MKVKLIIGPILLMVVFSAMGLIMFTENVRPVQIAGLFACGAVFGASLTAIISAFRLKQTKV
jgi:hypothetical protein